MEEEEDEEEEVEEEEGADVPCTIIRPAYELDAIE